MGLTRRQIAAFNWKRRELPPQLELNTRVTDAVDRVVSLRDEIREAGPGTPQWELEDKWEQVEATLKDVRFFGDLAIEAFFLEKKVKAREARRRRHLDAVLGWAGPEGGVGDEHRKRLEAKRKASPTFAPFHWEVEFPEVFERENPGFDAFVGNPPFGGKNTVAAANINSYPLWLKALHAKSHGNSDLVAHFFRRVFDLLRDGGTFGLIATNTIGQGDTRSSGLRWICQNGGEIYRALTRFAWPGQAAVVVSVVHVMKGEFHGAKHLDGRPVDEITAFLFHTGGHDDPVKLEANENQSFQGSIVLGMGFTFDDTDTKGVASPLSEMRRLIEKDPKNAEVIFPCIGGSEVNTSPTHEHRRYVINFREYPLRRANLGEQWEDADARQRTVWLRSGIVSLDYPGPVAADWPDLLAIVEERVRPARAHLTGNAIGRKRAKFWWQYGSLAKELQTAIADLERVLFHGFTCQHLQFAFLDRDMVYAGPHNVFALDTYAAFCALQTRPHEIWARFFASTLEDRLRYTPSDVFETFPLPPGWTTHTGLEVAGQAYYDFRADLMVMNNEGLTKTYNRFHDPHERDPDIERLRQLHAVMDRAVLDAYGWNDIPTDCEYIPEHADEGDSSGRRKRQYRYRWPDSVRDEVLGRLMELNGVRAAEEEKDER